MKVKDVMQTDVVYVSSDTPLVEVARLIFEHRINGIAVCEGKKLIGMITEQDIMSQFFPTMQEYAQDYVHARDFEEMEEKAKEILSYPASRIMSKKPETITKDEPLLKAQSLMQVHEIGRLPVVDENGNLTGIVSKGDIFNAVVGKDVSIAWGQEELHDWIAKYYDSFIDWKERLSAELPLLLKFIKQRKVQKIIDIGCATGEHDIALVKTNGFSVLGIEKSQHMIDVANSKKETLPQKLKEKLNFIKLDRADLPKSSFKGFDAALILGGVISHSTNLDRDLNAICSSLNPDKNLIIIQMPDYELILKKRDRFSSLTFFKRSASARGESAFIIFYDFRNDGLINLNNVILESDGKKWKPKGIGTAVLNPITKKQLNSILEKKGYKVRVLQHKSLSVFNPKLSREIFIIGTKN